jgi:glycerol kinase
MTPTDAFVPGDSPVPSTLAWLTDRPTYAREGNILSSGATLAWTTELLGLASVAELVQLAAETPDSGGVSFVPAFSGLGAPYWDRTAEALMVGMTGATSRSEVARAAVESVAHQICDVVEEIERDSPTLKVFRADGGASASSLLMQIQADLLDRKVEVADLPEVSALGAARMGWATLGATSQWASSEESTTAFIPQGYPTAVTTGRTAWRDAVARSRSRAVSDRKGA